MRRDGTLPTGVHIGVEVIGVETDEALELDGADLAVAHQSSNEVNIDVKVFSCLGDVAEYRVLYRIGHFHVR